MLAIPTVVQFFEFFVVFWDFQVFDGLVFVTSALNFLHLYVNNYQLLLRLSLIWFTFFQ